MEIDIQRVALFLVEFGEPTHESYSRCPLQPLFVIAKSYNEAAKKAETFMINKKEQTVLDADGSIKVEEINVRSVKIVSKEIIF